MDREELKQAAELADLIMSGDHDEIAQRMATMHPADIAVAIRDLPMEAQSLAFGLLSDDDAAVVLLEIEADDLVGLLRLLGASRSRLILGEMGPDDIADLLGDVGASDIAEVLALLEKNELAEVQRLLDYPERSAGGIMTTEYVALPHSMTAAQAIEYLRHRAPDAETVYYVYVVTRKRQLVGVLSLRDLITAPVDSTLESFMQTNVISVNAAVDQEEVAQAVARYDLLAVPVVDDDNILVGIVTVDDVIDVIEEEVTEDIHRMGGTLRGEDDLDAAFVRVKKRLPWLIILLFGNMIGAYVLRSFTSTLEAVVVLAYFIPVLIDMGGNVGVQSLAVTVRALATRGIEMRHVGRILAREAKVGISLGAICGALVSLVAYVWQGNLYLGVIVGISMASAMAVAALIGTMVPLVLDRCGADAAIASGPFITTFCDVIGLLIYFGLATWMLRLI